jgi:glycosyltransferase involved in cell wall biosynthesis
MDYAPNEDAALWLAQEIWPAVRAARPDATLTFVGPNPTARLTGACAADASIHITGRVPDVRPALWDSAVSVAPLRVARGLQNKALEALAAGLPTVITSAVAAGLPPSALAGCAVADTAAECAARILELLALDPDGRRARAARADLDAFSWSTTLAPLRTILQAAIDARTV